MTETRSRVGIYIALEPEAVALLGYRPSIDETHALANGMLLCVGGMGRVHAQRCTEQLIADGAVALVSLGTAAGLSTNQRPGDLLLPDKLVNLDRQQLSPCATWLVSVRQQLQRHHMSVADGTLITVDNVIASPAAKARLAISSGAMAADMESFAVVNTANEHGIPGIALRIVTDGVDLCVPEAITENMDNHGRLLNTGNLAGSLLRHPGQVAQIFQLALAFRRATVTLRKLGTRLSLLTLPNQPG